MKKCNRYLTSLLLTIIYLMISFSPLSSLVLQSKHIAHAVTGECSGDCKIDGCSLERSAAQTCCCAQKKLSARKISPTDAAKTPRKVASCCATKTSGDADSVTATESSPTKNNTAHISSKPCGSGKLFTLLSIETTQHLPYFFTENVSSPLQSAFTVIPPDQLTSRYVDPPDPPPIIS